MITPYLKPLSTQGGTLYVFPSVSKDLTRTFVSNDYEFKFSHFACLNLPDIYNGKYFEDGDSDPTNDLPKGLYLSTLMGSYAPSGEWTSDVIGKTIAENLQNYVMNFETAILNGEGDNDDYDNDILTSVSEKVFFNWLQKVGGIKFDSDSNTEYFYSYAERTVQYIGNIDVSNTVEINGDSFEELYLHIPSTAGASISVQFRLGELTDNKNYLDKEYVLGDDSEYIIGRKDGDESPYGLNIKSFVDDDTGRNSYLGDVGHTIDFRDSLYGGGYGINSMNANSLEDFEFNAVLIYYDFIKKTSDPDVRVMSTNLYGILFLDNAFSFDNAEDCVGYLQRYPKKKETVYGNGNSFGLKIDLKIDTIPDATYTNIKYLDPNSAASMTLYEKALTQLQKCIDIFYEQKNQINELYDRVSALENLVVGIDSISSLKDDINRLYDTYNYNGVVNNSTLLSLIEVNSKKINSILSGEKDLKLQYDIDVLQPGTGIGMKKSLNKVVISSEQKYYINAVTNGSITEEEVEITSDNPLKTDDAQKICNIRMQPGDNFAVVYMSDFGESTSDLIININDSEYNWSVGQSMKIHFVFEDGGSLVFNDNVRNGIIINFSENEKITIPGYEFEGNNLIEIICVKDDKFIYLIK